MLKVPQIEETCLSKCAQTSKDASTNPRTVFPLLRREYLDLHLLRCQLLQIG